MAEAFSVAAAAIGLLPLIKDGWGIIKDIYGAKHTAIRLFHRVEMQYYRFETWRDMWKGKNEEPDIDKFADFAKEYPQNARRVLAQLSVMSYTFADVKALQSKYGLEISNSEKKHLHVTSDHIKCLNAAKFSDGEAEKFIRECRVNISVYGRLKMALGSTTKDWEALEYELSQFNQNLRDFMPHDLARWLYIDEFNAIAQVSLDVKEIKAWDIQQSQARAQAFIDESSRSPDEQTASHNRELAALTTLQATLATTEPQPREVFAMSRFKITKEYGIPGSQSTMALLYDLHRPGNHRVVFIEWTQARHGKSQELKSNLWEISGVLSFQKPDSMLLPYSYGVVENLSEGQFGIVLMPPTHIRMHIPPLSQIPRGEISCRRMPSTLETLISVAIGSPAHGSGAGEPVDLGTRFRIARKLVDAIHIMHTVNLLHKNIRSSSVLFFPAAEATNRFTQDGDRIFAPSTEEPKRLDFDNIILAGFAHSRSQVQFSNSGDYDSASQVTLDYYQHPQKRRDPEHTEAKKFHDLYSLGCVLLEIALWKKLDQHPGIVLPMYGPIKPFRLTWMDSIVGGIYGSVVRDCLDMGSLEGFDDRKIAAFETDIAVRLSKCVA